MVAGEAGGFIIIDRSARAHHFDMAITEILSRDGKTQRLDCGRAAGRFCKLKQIQITSNLKVPNLMGSHL
jgi:hypothetical protein